MMLSTSTKLLRAARLSSSSSTAAAATTTSLRIPPRSFTSTAVIQLSSPIAPSLFDMRLNKIPPTGTQTKVVCTIGPATDTTDTIGALVEHGMHVARLNFSHAGSDYSYPEANMALVRNAAGKHATLQTGASIVKTAMPNNLRAILVDTKGPEIRTGPLQGNADVADIQLGATVEMTLDDVSGDDAAAATIGSDDLVTHRIHVDYASICSTVSVGKQILLDDGLIALEVVSIKDDRTVTCLALNGGPIKKNKGVNLPGMELDLPALTDKDKRDLSWACDVGADFVAASFIRTGANVRSVIAYLNRCIANLPDDDTNGNRPLRPLVISKIENKEGMDHFDEILKESDGIMVARGDLGVEIPYSKVFAAQKMMVQKCNAVGKPVIVATQMLDSMMRNPRPTRAEVTDVGTAVLDGADAVMLSGETAAGKYPIESLRSMASVVWEADQIHDEKALLIWNQQMHDMLSPEEQELDATAASAVRSATRMGARKIILVSETGRVARAVARHKPAVPVLAFCTDAQVARRLQLHRAITPIMLQNDSNNAPNKSTTRMGMLRAEALRTAKELGFVTTGDRVIFVDRTRGKSHDLHEYSHNMKIITLKET